MMDERYPLQVSEVVILTQEDINAYARASGDFNPIHVDEEYARKTPFGGTIAHGLLLTGIVSEIMTREFGALWCKYGILKTRFKNPAKPGDTLTFTASRRDNSSAGTASVYDVLCVNQRQETIIEGQARIVQPTPEPGRV